MQRPRTPKAKIESMGIGMMPMTESINPFDLQFDAMAESIKHEGGLSIGGVGSIGNGGVGSGGGGIGGLSQFNDFMNSFKSPALETPEYYRDFFTIAKEMVKPMKEKFALEICYLFDKLIEVSPTQTQNNVEDYQTKNQQVLLKLIDGKSNDFPKLSKLKQEIKDSFIQKFLFNLSHLFI